MAASIKGVQVLWGVSDTVRDAALDIDTEGIITGATVTDGGGTFIQGNEVNDEVSRVDHAAEAKITFEVVMTANTTLPEKGDALTFAALTEIDGIDIATRKPVVDDVKIDYANGAVKKVSISTTLYPDSTI
jgi:hypothetical protein